MTKRANEATLSARPSDPRLAQAQQLHHEERRLQAQAKAADSQRSEAWKETQELQIQKAAQDANVKALGESVDRTQKELFEARDNLTAVEREASSLETTDPAKAADLRENAAQLRSSIHDLEQVRGQNDARLTAAWDDVKSTEARLEARTADVQRLQGETDRLRALAEQRESAAEALEAQRAAEPLRADVPEVELLPDDAQKMQEALRNGHKVGVGSDGRIHISEERGTPMNQDAADYLQAKLPELRHRLGEDWNFSIEPNGNITGSGPHGATYFAQADGQLSERTLAEVRARLQSGEELSVGPDGTVITSRAADPVTQEQASANLAKFNQEVSSGNLAGQLAEGRGYDLNPDGSGGYAAPVPVPAPASPPEAPTGAVDPSATGDPAPAPADAGTTAGAGATAGSADDTVGDAEPDTNAGAADQTPTGPVEPGATGVTEPTSTEPDVQGGSTETGTASDPEAPSAANPAAGTPDDTVGDTEPDPSSDAAGAATNVDAGTTQDQGHDVPALTSEQGNASEADPFGGVDDASSQQPETYASDDTWEDPGAYDQGSALAAAEAPAQDEYAEASADDDGSYA